MQDDHLQHAQHQEFIRLVLEGAYSPPRPKRAPNTFIKFGWTWKTFWSIFGGVAFLTLLVLFEVYKKEFEKWLSPAANWLHRQEEWSWIIPTLILVILSFPPLLGQELVLLLVGLTYSLWIGIAIACAGTIVGEAACFIAFKLFFTQYARKKAEKSRRWAATAKVADEVGFKGVMIIRYSAVPPHLANPIFASMTSMGFLIYNISVALSLPKTIIFVVLGYPANADKPVTRWATIGAVAFLVILTIWASWRIKLRLDVAMRDLEIEKDIQDLNAAKEKIPSIDEKTTSVEKSLI